MRYDFNGKIINIPDEEIKHFMTTLDLTEQEAIEMYLDDHEYTTNEVVEELTKKAKTNKTDKIVVQSKAEKTKTERKPKENPLKQAIIANIYSFLSKNPTLLGVTIENPTKTIDFYVEGKHFSLNLVEHRPKKEKN